MDLSPIALQFACKAAPRSQFVRCDLNHPLPFADETFDIVTIFNVVYHAWVASEAAVLSEARRVLKVGGLLLITEPAFRALTRELDAAGMTRRRYRRGQFVALLQAANLKVLFANYFTSFGAPLILGMKGAKALAGKRAATALPADLRARAGLNATMYGLACIEAHLVKASIPMPFGTTITALRGGADVGVLRFGCEV